MTSQANDAAQGWLNRDEIARQVWNAHAGLPRVFNELKDRKDLPQATQHQIDVCFAAADRILALASQPPAAPVEMKPFSAKENLREVVAEVRADINAAEAIQALALIIDPHADELDDRDANKLFDAARRVWAAGYRSPPHSPCSAANAADILMAAKALDYLSDHSRPNGGQENYNAEHLIYLAEKLRKLAAHLTNEPQPAKLTEALQLAKNIIFGAQHLADRERNYAKSAEYQSHIDEIDAALALSRPKHQAGEA